MGGQQIAELGVAVTASGQGVDGPGGGARLIALRRLFARRSNQKIADLATHRV